MKFCAYLLLTDFDTVTYDFDLQQRDSFKV